MRTLARTGQAAKLRHLEDTFPDAAHMYEQLLEIQLNHWQRPLGPWHKNSFINILIANEKQLRAIGVIRAGVSNSLNMAQRDLYPSKALPANASKAKTLIE